MTSTSNSTIIRDLVPIECAFVTVGKKLADTELARIVGNNRDWRFDRLSGEYCEKDGTLIASDIVELAELMAKFDAFHNHNVMWPNLPHDNLADHLRAHRA